MISRFILEIVFAEISGQRLTGIAKTGNWPALCRTRISGRQANCCHKRMGPATRIRMLHKARTFLWITNGMEFRGFVCFSFFFFFFPSSACLLVYKFIFNIS